MENTCTLSTQEFLEIKPKILYYGMPVFLLSTLNEDGTTNISPMSSSWTLGDYIVLGIGLGGKALINLERHSECVINLPNPELWSNVEKIGSFTGLKEVPEYKRKVGFTYQKDKFEAAGFTPLDSKTVLPKRIQECPMHIEASVKNIRINSGEPNFAIVETQMIHFHALKSLILKDNYIDPSKWHPLIYNFRHYFSLGNELGKSSRSET